MSPNRLSPSRRLKSGLLLLLFALAIPCAFGQSAKIVIDPYSPGRIFDGLGALSAGASSRLLIDYPEPQRSQILDYLFKPGYGAALQRLKVEIGADVNSTDGAEPSHMRTPTDHDSSRGYEWWLMVEAHKRNPHIILEVLPWGAPAWIGEPNADSLYTPNMAAYIADWIETAKRDYNLDIAYAGSWNEKVYDIPYIKELNRQLAARQLHTKIVCCDEYIGQGQGESKGQWAIADQVLKDPELASAISAIGAHYPLDKGHITTTPAARKTGKPLWSSEDQPNSGSGPFLSRDWNPGGRILAHLYNQNYLEGSLTATEIWSPITSYYDNLAAPNSGLMYANTPWSGYYNVQSTIWVTAHTTQFAQPGWQYLDKSSGMLAEKGSYVTLRSPDKKNWSVVLETIGATHPQTVSFETPTQFANREVYVWETNRSRTFERVATVKLVKGRFEYSFDPDSIYSFTTTTGQGKGTARPPAAAPFPLLYKDDFESTAINRSPKYLADQDGAFEVHACKHRAGRCLEQVITTKPIPWGPLPDPFTLAGDAEWSDYAVSADVRFLTSAAVTLMGRIDSADVFQDGKLRWPSGYILVLHPDGNWQLLSTQYKKLTVTLATGKASIDADHWHHIELTFHGSHIGATLDGVSFVTVDDTTHPKGMFALGSEWDHVQFDNLEISR